MALNMSSPVVRAAFGMVVGAGLVMVLEMIPGLDFLNIWYAVGAGAFGAVGMVAMGARRARSNP